MYHSVTFGEKNSWDDWHLIPATRPFIEPAKLKSKWVDIPGSNGQIEIFSKVYGGPFYDLREGSIEFIIADYETGVGKTWADLYAEITEYMHGKTMDVILEDEPDYVYHGMTEVETFTPGENYSTITIAYKLDPERKVNPNPGYGSPTQHV